MGGSLEQARYGNRTLKLSPNIAAMWRNPGIVMGLFPYPEAGFTKNYALACFDPRAIRVKPDRFGRTK
jgi:hypothetical protein